MKFKDVEHGVKNNDIAGLMVPSRAITNFIIPTCDYELAKFKQSTSHCFHMYFLTTTFLFTIILVAREAPVKTGQW